MDVIQDYLNENPNMRYVAAGVVASASLYVLSKSLGLLSKKEKPLPVGPPNTVLLLQLARGPYAPSLSPFPIKLETYLRITGIPYQNDLSSQMSPKGKTPWMVYNGEQVSDSQFCIEYLNKKFDKDLNGHLDPAQRAAADAVRIMIDEHLYWPVGYFRWVQDPVKKLLHTAFDIPRFIPLIRMFARRLEKQAHAQGIGRHTPDEIKHIWENDLRILTDFLGTKKFLTGDTPCEADCSAFGLLSQMIWQNEAPMVKDIMKGYPALVSYCERIKDTYWPDWDECITHGGTRRATK